MIFDHIKITCSKSDLRSDQDHDLEFSQKVIGDKIVILDHFLGRSLWIFFPQFSELRFGFNIVVWVLFPNNSSFLCIFQVRIFDLRLLIKDSNFYWLCQVLSLESDTRLCIKKLPARARCFRWVFSWEEKSKSIQRYLVVAATNTTQINKKLDTKKLNFLKLTVLARIEWSGKKWS